VLVSRVDPPCRGCRARNLYPTRQEGVRRRLPYRPSQWVSTSVAVPASTSVATAPATTSLVSPVRSSRRHVAVPAQSYRSPYSSPPSPHSSDPSPNSPLDKCLTPPSVKGPTSIAQQPSIAHGSSHIHTSTADTASKGKPISSILSSHTHMFDPSFAFAGTTVR